MVLKLMLFGFALPSLSKECRWELLAAHQQTLIFSVIFSTFRVGLSWQQNVLLVGFFGPGTYRVLEK